MDLNGLELAAIIKMGTAMVFADGRVEPIEQKVMANEILRFGVKTEDLERILAGATAMDVQVALLTLSQLGSEQKKYVTAYLGTIMASDGKIDDSEMKLWRFVSQVCNFPTMSVSEAINVMASL